MLIGSSERVFMERQDNTNKCSVSALPYYVEIQKKETTKIKIPCSSELVAKKVLSNYKTFVKAK